jgi:hypothetical protein
MGQGRMNVGRLNAASIEVSPGGQLQGLIEKYVARPKPGQEMVGASEDEPQAQAA